jgi:succinate-semialdehyde dehydrogenase/glutarate-semialdehyde dehydrogenase
MSMIALKDPTLLRHAAFIDGEWQGADNNATFDVTDPATGESLGHVPSMGTMETRRAINASNNAWPAWRKKTAKERAAVMRRWYELMLENADDLAMILTREQGKPLAEAKGEIGYAASFIEWFAEEGKRVSGDTLASPAADKRIVVTKEPIGVCARGRLPDRGEARRSHAVLRVRDGRARRARRRAEGRAEHRDG